MQHTLIEITPGPVCIRCGKIAPGPTACRGYQINRNDIRMHIIYEFMLYLKKLAEKDNKVCQDLPLSDNVLEQTVETLEKIVHMPEDEIDLSIYRFR